MPEVVFGVTRTKKRKFPLNSLFKAKQPRQTHKAMYLFFLIIFSRPLNLVCRWGFLFHTDFFPLIIEISSLLITRYLHSRCKTALYLVLANLAFSLLKINNAIKYSIPLNFRFFKLFFYCTQTQN